MTPGQRADATRNRERILAAAREAFAGGDLEVSMAEVARRAGVGQGTLYRNFADRRALLEALYLDEIDAVCAAAGAGAGGEAVTPGEALERWLRRFFTYFRDKREVAAELLAGRAEDDREFFDSGRARVLRAGAPLFAAAVAAGEVRGELTLDQVLDLVAAVARIPASADYLEPMLQTVFAGLRRW